jgi:glyoxalase family protein
MSIRGLHHFTAITGDAPLNLDFYTRIMGLRLVKKTVNQDDVSAYHLFYGDEIGRAGTELTFFDWPRAVPNHAGPGTITRLALRVPDEAALSYWVERFDTHDVPHGGITEFAGLKQVVFTDPEGQNLALITDGGKAGGTPWAEAPVPQERGITGLGAVTLGVRRTEPTARILTEVMGFREAGSHEAPSAGEAITAFEVAEGGPGTLVYLHEMPSRPAGRPGRGGVHHVAFRVKDDATQEQWLEKLNHYGIGNSGLVNRYYFRSLYFRVPSGILFEIATDGPGFATDEPVESLGESLALPPFLEPRREAIEAGLQPLEVTQG